MFKHTLIRSNVQKKFYYASIVKYKIKRNYISGARNFSEVKQLSARPGLSKVTEVI